MHSNHMVREGARLEVVRDNMGHGNIDVTHNVYAKSAGCLAKFRCEERDGGGKKLGQFGGISGTRDVVEQWKRHRQRLMRRQQ